MKYIIGAITSFIIWVGLLYGVAYLLHVHSHSLPWWFELTVCLMSFTAVGLFAIMIYFTYKYFTRK